MLPEPTLCNRYGLDEEVLIRTGDWDSEERDRIHSSTGSLSRLHIITLALAISAKQRMILITTDLALDQTSEPFLNAVIPRLRGNNQSHQALCFWVTMSMTLFCSSQFRGKISCSGIPSTSSRTL